MTIAEHIHNAPAERQSILRTLHEAIMANDPNVSAVIKPMMGKEMILYEQCGYIKYGLASTKNHLSLHCLPLYMNKDLHAKYEALLPAAKVQKGCINFMDETELSQSMLTALIIDCAAIDIADMLEKRKKK